MSLEQQAILILGGGINGASLARELVLQGARVWLVEKADLCQGATSGSSRLIHGGLRYLEFGEFSLVRESLEERQRLLQLAPGLVQPLRLYIPVNRRLGGWCAAAARILRAPAAWTPPAGERGLWLVRSGLAFYDWVARGSTLPPSTVLDVGAAGAPPVDPRTCRWLCSYYDAQIAWPERFVIASLRDAQRAAEESGGECRVWTHCSVERVQERVLLRRGGQVVAEWRPTAILNATGAWVDDTLQQLTLPSRRLMGGTKGSHLVTYHPELRQALNGGGIYAEAADGRPVFLLPFGPASLIGTTDLPFAGDPGEVTASEDEIEYLLQATRRVFPHLLLERQQVALHYCAVRPLPYVAQGTPAGITRRHWLEPLAAGPFPVYSVIGGKLTTCRSLAESTVATLAERWGRTVAPVTRDRPLADANDMPTLDTLDGCGAVDPAVIERVVREEWVTGLDDLVIRRLMLHFRRQFTRADLEPLADRLISWGVLSSDHRDAAIEQCWRQLNTRFGRS